MFSLNFDIPPENDMKETMKNKKLDTKRATEDNFLRLQRL